MRTMLKFWPSVPLVALFMLMTPSAAGGEVSQTMGNITFECPEGWEVEAPYCYLFVGLPMTVDDAKASCKMYGAELVQIQDEEEAIVVGKKAGKLSWNLHWIGNAPKTEDDMCRGFWDVGEPLTPPNIRSLDLAATPKGLWQEQKTYYAAPGHDVNIRLPSVCRAWACVEGTFRSKDGKKCVSKKYTCDGVFDCDDQSDENHCADNCATTIRSATGKGTITADRNKFKPGETCVWYLEGAHPGRPLSLKILNMDVAKDTERVEVWGGGPTLTTSKLLQTLHGKYTAAQQKMVFGTENFLIVRLVTDQDSTLPTFQAEFSEDAELSPEERKITATDNWIELTSPYLGKRQELPCVYARRFTVSAKEGSVIRMEVLENDVGDGFKIDSYTLLAVTEKNVYPRTYISLTNTFTFDIIATEKCPAKFKARVKTGCTTDVTRASGFVQAPVTPEHGTTVAQHAPSLRCTYIIRAPADAQRTFSLTGSYKFSDAKDRLNIFDGNSNAAKNLTNEGLTSAPNFDKEVSIDLKSTGPVVFVEFITSLTMNKGFFKLNYDVECPALDQTNMDLSSNETYKGTTTKVQCDKGYAFVQQEFMDETELTLTCGSEGKWNVTRLPTCRVIYCGIPELIANGYISQGSGDARYNATVTYKCFRGFSLKGSNVSTCGDGSKWSTQPTCEAQQCPDLAALTNGSPGKKTGSGTDFGTIFNFTCKAGYELIGSRYTLCQADGTWSHPNPTCQAIKCPIPFVKRATLTIMSGGKSITVNESSDPILLNAALSVKCDSGYQVNGTSSFTCLPSATFDLTSEVCQDIDECKATPAKCTKANMTCVNTEGSYTCGCEDKYKMVNNECKPIDRCALKTSGCDTTNGKCTPLNGGVDYKCECNDGYVLFTQDGLSGRNVSSPEDGATPGDVLYFNHTCVPKTCGAPPSVKNGKLLTQKKVFDFKEKAKYRCNFGYSMTGSEMLTCNASGLWDKPPPVCNAITCDALTATGKVENIYPNTTTSPGEEVKLECLSEYTGKPYNKTLFCAYDTKSKGFKLQGDNPDCPAIDCGTLAATGGAKFTVSGTGLGAKFTFACLEDYKLDGASASGNLEVTCGTNGRWGLGNLTCEGKRCTDPGTPGGTKQTKANFELEGVVVYECLKKGFKAVPENRTCKYENKAAKWDSSPPECVDVEDPVFKNCPTDTIKLKLYETVGSKIPKPVAEDNSGLVYYSVEPKLFTMDLVMVSPGYNVTYTATDSQGNKATCELHIQVNDPSVQPDLNCSKVVVLTVDSDTPVTYNLSDAVLSVESGAVVEYDRPATMKVAPDTVGTYPVRVTATNEFGLQRQCSFMVDIQAGVCLQTYIEPVPNATVKCAKTNDSLDCDVTCNDGFAYTSGAITEKYTCRDKNSWSSPLPLPPCLKSEPAKYVFGLNVDYKLAAGIEDCQEGIEAKLKTRIPTENLYCFYKFNKPMFFEVTATKVSFPSPEKAAVVLSLGIRSDIDASEIETSDYDACAARMSSKSNLEGMLSLTGVACKNKTGGQTLELEASTLVSNDKVCPAGSLRHDIRGVRSCVECSPGTYFKDGNCTACPSSQYQDEAGQLQCKTCKDPKQQSVVPRTSSDHCVASCPLGFANGETFSAAPKQCIACPEDEFLNVPFTASCTPCGRGRTTSKSTGQTKCTVHCGFGKYPLNNTHCADCPVGFYKDKDGNIPCTRCADPKKTTNSAGSNSSTDCDVPIKNPENCTTSKKDSPLSYCVCNFGHEGENCDKFVDACLSSPCYNGGKCNTTGVQNFTCACPAGFSGDRCEKDENNDCKTGTCSDSSFCRDLLGSADCVCPSSDKFKGPRCEINLNLCNPNPCKNEGTCADSGSGIRHTCTCKAGFTGENCETNIDECALNPSGCLYGGNCTDGVNSYTCACVDHKGDRCEKPLDFCGNNPTVCQNGLCYNDYDKSSAVCVCEFPYRVGANGRCEEIDVCKEDNPCKNNATCSKVTPGVVSCKCETGYNGTLCQHNIDDCSPDPCKNGKCKDEVNGYKCECDAGWNETNCDNNIDDRPTATCETKNTEKVEDLVNGFKCVCKAGFTGDNCETDIDECLSLPCQHGGNCSQSSATPGQYSCSCRDGWTGKNCEELTQFCKDNICEAGGTCHSLQDDFFCECLGGSSGKNCSTFSDLCAFLDPCMKPNKCKRVDNKATCSCPPNSYGSSCNRIKNGCLGDPCKNEGTCTLKSDGHSCKCKDGFEGPDCSTKIAVCTKSTCPPKIECVEVDGEAICMCGANQVKSENTCKKVSGNFDLFFTKPGDELRSTQPFRLTKDELTLMFWLAPLKDSVNKPVVQLRTGNSNLLAVDSLNVTFLTEEVKMAKPFVANQWNHFCITWTNTSFQLYLNGDNFQHGPPPSKLPSAPNDLVFIYIGADFTGYISQVTVWERVLPFTDVLKMLAKPLEPSTQDVVALWGHYERGKNIWTRFLIPSSATNLKKVCEGGKSGAACNDTKPDKEPPTLQNCPTEDQYKVTKRLVQIGDWGITGDNLHSNMNSSLLTSGVYRMAFITQDEQDNVAFCRFNAYIKLKSMTPDGPNQEQSCNAPDGLRKDAYKQCKGGLKIECPASGISISYPIYLTCGKLGSYHPQNPTMLPPAIICGAKSDVKATVTLQLKYKLGIACFPQALTQVGNGLKGKVKALNTLYPGLCPDDSCVETSDMKCDGNFVNAKVVIKAAPNKLTHKDTKEVLSAKEVLQAAVLEDDAFRIYNLFAAELQKTDVKITDDPTCEAGSGLIQSGSQKGSCVKCTKGSYLKEATKTCELCPLGTYTDTDGATSCKKCPTKQTSLQLGASECYKDCGSGSAFKMTVKDCQVCPKDFYSNTSRQVFCDPCPANTDSEGPGTKTIESCYETCEAGTELNGSLCVPCPRGKYSDGVDVDRCTDCPQGKTTPEIKSTSKSSCSQTACGPGTFLNKTSNECVSCDYGSYQPDKWEYKCLKCNASYTTENLKSTSPEQCLFVCEAGKETLDNKTCTACKQGFYRTNSMDDRFKPCTACNSTFTTPAAGSKSEDSCTIRICNAGNYRNVTENLCYPCPVGEYQPNALQTKCTPCPANTTTKKTGSDNSTQCIFICEAGYEVLSAATKTCQPCDRGQFKSNEGDGKFEKCKPCAKNTTNGVASTSADDCNIQHCTSGQKIAADGSCEDCPVDTFQDKELPDRKTTCRACPDNKGTTEGKRPSALECKPFCKPGKQFDKGTSKCAACPMGTYNNGNLTQRFEQCTKCPDGYVTEGEKTGATTADNCTLRDCPAGKYIDGKDCTPCPVGTYQDIPRQTKCKDCKKDTNTSGPGKAKESDCTISCEAGKEQKPNSQVCTRCEADKVKKSAGSGTCEQCTSHFTSNQARTVCDVLYCDRGSLFVKKTTNNPIEQCVPCAAGTYKDTRGNGAKCVDCPVNTTTAAPGGESKDSCSKANCDKGFFSPDDTLPCQPCPLATYKNVIGNINCTACDKGFTTSAEASTDKNQCSVVVCPVGKKRNTKNTCEDCPVGTYQNETGQTTCISCPNGYTTVGTAKSSATDCKIVCPQGSFRDDGTNTCKECPQGQFQPATGKTSCTACQQGYTTAKNGSKSSTDCYVLCGAGKYAVSRDKCEPCQLGKYQSTDKANECSSCEAGNTTLKTGSTSADDCMPLCAKGEYLNTTTRMCLKCPLGQFNPEAATMAKTVQKCQECPTGNTTSSTGSVSVNDCSIADCERGSKRSTNGGCELCPLGQYQPKKSQMDCLSCSTGLSTLMTGRFFASSCVSKCAAAHYYDVITKKCEQCNLNFTRAPAESTLCYRCPPGFVTLFKGQTSCTKQAGGETEVPTKKTGVRITAPAKVTPCKNNAQVNKPSLFEALWQIVLKILAATDKRFGGKICNGDCSKLIKVKVKSGCLAGSQRGKRAASDPSDNVMEVEIPNVDNVLTEVGTGKVYDTIDVIKEAFYNSQAAQDLLDNFHMEIPGVSGAEAMVTCSPGQKTVSAQCEPCPAGSFSTQGVTCKLCPVNSYQAATGQTSCNNCANKTYTSTTGANSDSMCLRKCQHSNARDAYCSGHGKCEYSESASDGVRCVCDDSYSGTDCSVKDSSEDNKTQMVAGIVGGICAFLIILLIIFGVVACLRRGAKKNKDNDRRSKQPSVQEDGRSDGNPNYNYPAMFDPTGRPYPMGAPALMYMNPEASEQEVRDFYNDRQSSSRSKRNQ